MPRDWMTLVDQLLQEAQESGKFDNLPQQGKHIKLDKDPYTPSDMRLANKLLKDNDLLPEWIMLRKDIEALQGRLLDDMKKGLRAYKGAVADAERSPNTFERQSHAEAAWNRAKAAYQRSAERINRQILSYNLKVPSGVPQKPLFNVDRELERLL